MGHSPAGACPWAGSCTAPQWHRAHWDGAGSPVLMTLLMMVECDRGQEQAAQGHRPISTSSAQRQGRGGPPRGRGMSMGGN